MTMDCCRICLATDELSEIFVTEEIVPNIMAIACVDIRQDDDLPQYICLLCNHELDIAINFKNKCETTFDILKERHNKELEVKENIILNLLSGGKTLDEKLPEGAIRESILNTVKNSVKNDMKGISLSISDGDDWCGNKHLLKNGKEISNSDQVCDSYRGNNKPEKVKKMFLEQYQYLNRTQIGVIDQEEISNDMDNDQMIDTDDQTTTMTDGDDQMTDITENEFEISESLSIRNQELMCMKCNFCFVNEESLLDHLKRIHSKTMGQCQICMSYFPTGELLKDHLRFKHDVLEDNKNRNDLVYRCKICNKTFVHQSELNSHLCLRPDQEHFWCDLCHLNLKFISEFENHMKYSHQQENFDCEYCDRKFTLIDLYNHLKEHSENKNSNRIELLCSECNKSFLSNEEWNKHMKWCQPKENAIGKETKNLNDLLDKNQRRFVCPLCQKRFKTNSMLEIHIRIHTGEMPFKCAHCHKSFGKSSHLAAHQRTHNDTKPHVCSICQMSFYKGNSLEKHLLQHKNLIQFTRKETFISVQVNHE